MSDEVKFNPESEPLSRMAARRRAIARKPGPSPWLVWLVAGHIGAILLVFALGALTVRAGADGIAVICVYAALSVAQGSVIGVFLAVGKTGGQTSCLPIVVTAILISTPPGWLFVPALLVGPLAMLSSLPLAFWYSRLTRDVPASLPALAATEDRPLQFSLRGMMVSTFVIGLVVLIGKWLRSQLGSQPFGILMGVAMPLLTLPAPLAWSILVRTTSVARFLGATVPYLVLTLAILATEQSIYIWRVAMLFGLWYWGLFSLSLWMLRKAGFRLIPHADWSRWQTMRKIEPAGTDGPLLDAFSDFDGGIDGDETSDNGTASGLERDGNAGQADSDAESARE